MKSNYLCFWISTKCIFKICFVEKKLRSDWNFESTFGSFKPDALACHQHAVLTNCEGLFNKFSIRLEHSEIHFVKKNQECLTSYMQAPGSLERFILVSVMGLSVIDLNVT